MQALLAPQAAAATRRQRQQEPSFKTTKGGDDLFSHARLAGFWEGSPSECKARGAAEIEDVWQATSSMVTKHGFLSVPRAFPHTCPRARSGATSLHWSSTHSQQVCTRNDVLRFGAWECQSWFSTLGGEHSSLQLTRSQVSHVLKSESLPGGRPSVTARSQKVEHRMPCQKALRPPHNVSCTCGKLLA